MTDAAKTSLELEVINTIEDIFALHSRSNAVAMTLNLFLYAIAAHTSEQDDKKTINTLTTMLLKVRRKLSVVRGGAMQGGPHKRLCLSAPACGERKGPD